jgi:hypothetical protein
VFIKPVCRAFADDVAVDGDSASVSPNARPANGNLFRYSDGQYIFNLNTKPLSLGTYEPLIDLGDDVPHAVTIALR